MQATSRTWKSVAAAAGCLAVSFTITPAGAAETLIYASYISEVYSASKTDIWMMAEIEKRSGGEIKFEKYWSSSLLKAPDLFPALRSGAADVVLGAPHAYNVREYPLANVVMPFTSTKADAMTRAWQDLYKNNADFRAEYESKGAKVLYSLSWAENTVWSRKPLSKVADFNGLKVRAVPTVSNALQKLGATPVALAWPDGLEGLQRGVVDAMSSAPFDSAVHGGAQEVAKFGTDAGGVGIFAMATIAISLDRYNKLSAKHRKIIDDVAAEAPERGLEFLEASMTDAVAKLCATKGGLTINLFGPEEVAKVQALAGAGMQGDWLTRVKAETKADGPAILKEFLGYVRSYEKTSTYESGFDRYSKTCGKS